MDENKLTVKKIIFRILIVLGIIFSILIFICIYMTDQNDIYLFLNDIDANIIARILVLLVLVILLMLIFMLPFQWKWRFTFAVVIVWVMMTVFLIVCFRTGAELPAYRRIYSPDRTYELVIMETSHINLLAILMAILAIL